MNTQAAKTGAATNTPREIGKPLAPATQVTRIRYSPDGGWLAAACFDGTVKRIQDPEAAALALARPPGKAKDALKEIEILANADWPAIRGHNGWVTSIAFAGQTLFSADSWGRVTATDVSARESKTLWSVAAAHDGWVRALALAPDGSRLATCGRDGFVRTWNTMSGKSDAQYDMKSDVLSVCFAPGGKAILAGDLFGIIREIGGRPARTFEAREMHKLDRIQDVGGVKNLLVSGDGKLLLAGGAEPKSGGFVQAVPLLLAFDLVTGRRVGQFRGANDNEGYVTDLAWHKNGYVAFTTSGQPGQGKLHLWKPGEEKPFFSGGKLPNCHSVAIHPTGASLAVSATNANSSGNGRVKGTGGEYPANTSPIQLWALPGK